ncbi:MAG: hypothetical protein LBG92_02540 [Prevotellaceae bacterium]|jgi:hypothetical protein|nr:hypothetical protein [Prevotellaceae bacterium]
MYRIKQLSKGCQMLQRKLATDLEIDAANCCKMEKVKRSVHFEHIPIISELLQDVKEKLLTFLIADQVMVEVADERELASITLKIVQKTLINLE